MFGNIPSNPNPTPATGGSTFGLYLPYSLGIFYPDSLYQGHLGVVTTIHLCLITQSPPLGLARLEVEGHLPLVQLVERLVRRHHLSRPRRIQACLGSRMRPGARLEPVLSRTSRQQARSDQRIVCFLGRSCILSLYDLLFLSQQIPMPGITMVFLL